MMKVSKVNNIMFSFYVMCTYIFYFYIQSKRIMQYHTLHIITIYGLLPYINPSLVYSSEIPLDFFRNIHKYQGQIQFREVHGIIIPPSTQLIGFADTLCSRKNTVLSHTHYATFRHLLSKYIIASQNLSPYINSSSYMWGFIFNSERSIFYLILVYGPFPLTILSEELKTFDRIGYVPFL